MITIVHKFVWRWKDHLTVPVLLVLNFNKTELLVQVNKYKYINFVHACIQVLYIHIHYIMYTYVHSYIQGLRKYVYIYIQLYSICVYIYVYIVKNNIKTHNRVARPRRSRPYKKNK